MAFDGRVHHLERGYWLKFEIARVEPSSARPHGLRCAFSLHDPDGNRLVGFDNAHSVARPGSRMRKPARENDHWHRTRDDPGRPYAFTTVDQLLADFFAEARRVLDDRGVSETVVSMSEKRRRD